VSWIAWAGIGAAGLLFLLLLVGIARRPSDGSF